MPRWDEPVASQSRGWTGAAAGSPDHAIRPTPPASVTASLDPGPSAWWGGVPAAVGGLPPRCRRRPGRIAAGRACRPHRAERGALIQNRVNRQHSPDRVTGLLMPDVHPAEHHRGTVNDVAVCLHVGQPIADAMIAHRAIDDARIREVFGA